MSSVRSLIAGIPGRAWQIAIVVALVIGGFGFQGWFGEIRNAKCWVDDIREAVELVEGGAIEFEGRCWTMYTTNIEDARFEAEVGLRSAQQWLDRMMEPIKEDPWGSAFMSVSGPVLIGVLLFGSISAGATMESGTTGWALSNGWGRRRWVRTFLILAAGGGLALYLVLGVLALLGQVVTLNSLDLSTAIGAPGWSVLAPISGFLFYGVLTVGFGFLLKRETGSLMAAIGFAMGETVASNYLQKPPVLPALLRAIANGSAQEPPFAWWVAALILLAATVLIGVGIYWWFVRKADVPDRPL